jgi:sensor histidine kinase regulating citrate/malate metabolism
VVVSLVNDCDTPPRKDLRTTKKDGTHHGIGLKSIQRVVERYHGIQTVYYDEKNRQFHHVIHFP